MMNQHHPPPIVLSQRGVGGFKRRRSTPPKIVARSKCPVKRTSGNLQNSYFRPSLSLPSRENPSHRSTPPSLRCLVISLKCPTRLSQNHR
ncbi:hypothetical protein SLA2020_491490 [Shorea laevis]